VVKDLRGWKSLLKADPTEWLLGEDNPSVRYFTLTDVLEKSENDPGVKKSRKAIMQTGAVSGILAKQKSDGYWGVRENFYIKGKYRGTVWQLIILAELGADPEEERVRKACEFILENSHDRGSGGFSYMSASSGGGAHGKVLPCLTGNMVWSLIRLSYLKDARVQKGIEWIVKYQRFDDGVKEAAKGWPFDRHERCWGRHSCHMGVVKALKALAEIPPAERSADVKCTIEKGAEYLLKHHVHKRSHDLTRVSKPEWLRFGFPLMWNTDVLEILGILTKLGYSDRRMQEAVDLVASKQDETGRWRLERSFNGRFQVNIEQEGKPSKWVTLNALMALKRFYAR
jgi:hypothetical protein